MGICIYLFSEDYANTFLMGSIQIHSPGEYPNTFPQVCKHFFLGSMHITFLMGVHIQHITFYKYFINSLVSTWLHNIRVILILS